MAGWLEGRVALVTGGASGIGRAVVARYVEEGARVAILDISPEQFEATPPEEDAVLVLGGDVRSMADNERAVAETVSCFGKLDIFIGNSGVGDGFVELVDLDPATISDAFDEMFGVNVKGFLLGAKAALPELVKTRGCMIFTLSTSSFLTDGGGPLYISAKHACLGLMRQLSHELAPVVRVNGVAPGGTATDIRLLASFGLDEDGRQRRSQDGQGVDGEEVDIHEALREISPLLLSPEPADHAGAYVLLGSEENARNITGTVIDTDGGLRIKGIRRTRGGESLEGRFGTGG
jgi:NAD(P)-dependent dehydrogenase (short-subunit alcohol dehydrogenase family)